MRQRSNRYSVRRLFRRASSRPAPTANDFALAPLVVPPDRRSPPKLQNIRSAQDSRDCVRQTTAGQLPPFSANRFHGKNQAETTDSTCDCPADQWFSGAEESCGTNAVIARSSVAKAAVTQRHPCKLGTRQVSWADRRLCQNCVKL